MFALGNGAFYGKKKNRSVLWIRGRMRGNGRPEFLRNFIPGWQTGVYGETFGFVYVFRLNLAVRIKSASEDVPCNPILTDTAESHLLI